ncbi:MAG: hypothetical protein AAGI52_05965 [Bacteroidota bacterium]
MTKAEFLAEMVFAIKGRGPVVGGQLVSGGFEVGDELCSLPGPRFRITGIETGRKVSSPTGEFVGLLLWASEPENVKSAIEPGQRLQIQSPESH